MCLSNLPKRLITFLLLVLGGLFAQEQANVDFDVSLDYSRFSIQGGVYLDVYLMVPQSAFTFVEGDQGVEARVVFQTALLQGDIVPYAPDRWNRTYRGASQAAARSLGWVPEISKFYVEPGDYTLLVTIVDVHSKKKQTLRRPISLELFPEDELSISDVTLASQVVKAKQENEFTRYGYDVVPNAQRTFTSSAPMMYYFFEAYGLSAKGTYDVHAKILSLNGDVVKDIPSNTKPLPGTSVVEWGGLNTAGLGSGIYKLAIQVTDGATQKTTSKKRTFYILKERASAGEGSETIDPYAGLTPAQVDDIFQLVSLIMDQTEVRLFNKSDDEGKKRVLTSFWQRNDPTPETSANEFKENFYRRVKMANRDFGSGSDDGWKTDRGRVLIQYGSPNNIEKQQSSIDSKPWITWEYYDVEGGVRFIFIDRTGYGSFQLVHSDARNEIQDNDWQRFLD